MGSWNEYPDSVHEGGIYFLLKIIVSIPIAEKIRTAMITRSISMLSQLIDKKSHPNLMKMEVEDLERTYFCSIFIGFVYISNVRLC